MRGSSFYSSLPPALYSQLILQEYELILSKINLFAELITKGYTDFVSRCVTELRSMEADENDVIIERNDLLTALFFVLKGRVRMEGSYSYRRIYY
jgi:hypothetical protein